MSARPLVTRKVHVLRCRASTSVAARGIKQVGILLHRYDSVRQLRRAEEVSGESTGQALIVGVTSMNRWDLAGKPGFHDEPYSTSTLFMY